MEATKYTSSRTFVLCDYSWSLCTLVLKSTIDILNDHRTGIDIIFRGTQFVQLQTEVLKGIEITPVELKKIDLSPFPEYALKTQTLFEIRTISGSCFYVMAALCAVYENEFPYDENAAWVVDKERIGNLLFKYSFQDRQSK